MVVVKNSRNISFSQAFSEYKVQNLTEFENFDQYGG